MSEWHKYEHKAPESGGVYEWRMPSKVSEGLIIRCFAKFRMRGAGYTTVLSPEFDYWDGYRVSVPSELYWRECHEDISDNFKRMSAWPEDVSLEPCPYCKCEPTWKHYQRHGSGLIALPDPHRLNSWELVCCDWAKTPSFKDPRTLAAQRNEMIVGARTAIKSEPSQ